jgi:hypothetical protein
MSLIEKIVAADRLFECFESKNCAKSSKVSGIIEIGNLRLVADIAV